MKIVFISNRLTPHQIPLSNALYSFCDGRYVFVETLKELEGFHVGWLANGENYPYVQSSKYVYEHLDQVKSEIFDADVAVIGSAPDSFIVERLRAGKLTFKYSERFYKTGLNYKNVARAIIGSWLHHGRFQKYPLYMLCASAFTSADASIFNCYKDRCFKWGYFPELREYSSAQEIIGQKNTGLIVWAARQIDWKHPEIVIELANRLKNDGIPFHIHMIGDGELLNEIKQKVETLELNEWVTILGSMKPSKVRQEMEKAGIFLCTSDFQEGWGAVLNEAMNSGCAVVASHAIGAVPYLIQNGKNGSVYENGNIDELFQKVKQYLLDPELQKGHGVNAYHTIRDMWNGDVAARRFVALCESMIDGKQSLDMFSDGPCSIATVMKNDWYHSEEE